MTMLLWISGPLVALGLGCSHADFQYEPAAPEAKRLVDTPASLIAAGEAKDTGAVAGMMDPEGRKAMLLIAHDVAGQKSEAARAIDALALGIMIGMAFGAEDAELIDFAEKGLEYFKPRMESELATSLLAKGSASKLLPDLVADMKDRPEVRRPKLAASFIAGLPSGCRTATPIVSYNASILDHIDYDWAKESTTFDGWKARVRAMHLVRVDCAEKIGLWVMSSYADETPRLAAWHYFTPAQWAKLEPKIDDKLELEDES